MTSRYDGITERRTARQRGRSSYDEMNDSQQQTTHTNRNQPAGPLGPTPRERRPTHRTEEGVRITLSLRLYLRETMVIYVMVISNRNYNQFMVKKSYVLLLWEWPSVRLTE